MKTKVSVDVRVDPSDKASWQAEAEERGISVSDLVRERMSNAPSVRTMTEAAVKELAAVQAEIAARQTIDLDAPELQSLRGWLSLADSDGVLDAELLAEWKAYAYRHGITLDDLLERVVIDANAALIG